MQVHLEKAWNYQSNLKSNQKSHGTSSIALVGVNVLYNKLQ